MSATAGPSGSNTLPDGTKLPPGVVLDKDGKPYVSTLAGSFRGKAMRSLNSRIPF